MKLKIKENINIDRWSISIQQRIRNALCVNLDDLVSVINKHGESIALQVVDSSDETAAFVNPEIYRKLNLNDESNIKHINNITIGCDPEFFIVESSTGRVVRPSVFLKNGRGQLGYDGAMMEIRPSPSEDELILLNNIGELIGQTRHMLDISGFGHDLILLASSCYDGYTAGFHLHYGLPKQLLNPYIGAKRVACLMTYVMDYYIGTISVISEGNDFVRRSSPAIKYGKPGGFNLDNKTFEYRFPGGSFLRHPQLTLGLITLGKVVVEDIVSRVCEATDGFTKPNEFSTIEDAAYLYPNIPPVKSLFEILCNCNTSLASRFFERITDDVSNMMGYYVKRQIFEDFFNNITTNYSNHMDKNWGGIPNGRKEEMAFQKL